MTPLIVGIFLCYHLLNLFLSPGVAKHNHNSHQRINVNKSEIQICKKNKPKGLKVAKEDQKANRHDGRWLLGRDRHSELWHDGH